MLNRFNPDFSKTFYTRFSETSPEMTALDSINAIKKNLAHMGAYDLKLTLDDIEEYFNRVTPVLEVLELILS